MTVKRYIVITRSAWGSTRRLDVLLTFTQYDPALATQLLSGAVPTGHRIEHVSEKTDDVTDRAFVLEISPVELA